MIVSYKYRLKNASYGRRLRRHAISLNQVWNYDVTVQKRTGRYWKEGAPKQHWLGEYDFNRMTAGVSKELNVHAGSIHEINRIFVQSRNRIKRSPRFRRSFGPKRSLGWVPFRATDRRISGNSVRFAGKTYKWYGDRSLPKEVKGGAFFEDSRGRWWVCFNVEIDADSNHGSAVVGIDLGLKTFATLSTGESIKNPRIYDRFETRLAVAHRARNKKRIKTLNDRIKNIRSDFHHKETTRLIRACCFMAVGNVSSSKLAKTRMAKSVLDAGWGSFREKLRYKARRHGVEYVDVDEKFTSQVCSSCRSNPASSPKGMNALGVREWVCSDCGAVHDRDVNAARNILMIALSAQRPVEGIREVPKELAG